MKVAMVITKVAHALGQDLQAGDEGCEAISREIASSSSGAPFGGTGEY